MIKIYKDDAANAIFIEDANGGQFLNSLQALVNSSNVDIRDLAKDIDLVTGEAYAEFVDENGTGYGNNSTDVVNALNALFQSSGTPTDEVPNITSSLTINLTQGQTVNYELTADYGVAYEWDFSSVPGITTVDGNIRKLIGGTGLLAGTYNIPVKAINYNGEDSETIVLTVSTPPFSNTKSVNFNNNDYCDASNPSALNSILGRSGNGSGSSDAWSVSLYFKPGTASNGNQTLAYFGAQLVADNGYVQFKYDGGTGAKNLTIRYGTNNNRIEVRTPNSAVSVGTWHHVLFTYDGGTTGAASGSISDYYSRFKIFVDGVQQTLTGSHSNFGYTGSISGDNFRLGRWNTGQNLRNNCRLDEVAIWDSDQSANVSAIRNGGTPFDMQTTLTTPPDHWWRCGDGDTYPTLQDSIGSVDLEMINMTSADIVSDVP